MNLLRIWIPNNVLLQLKLLKGSYIFYVHVNFVKRFILKLFCIFRFILHSKKTAFVVEHDFIMATYLADRVVLFDGQPSVDARANAPESLLTGCNKFLKNLDVTFQIGRASCRERV